jgi:hypothetical protein
VPQAVSTSCKMLSPVFLWPAGGDEPVCDGGPPRHPARGAGMLRGSPGPRCQSAPFISIHSGPASPPYKGIRDRFQFGNPEWALPSSRPSARTFWGRRADTTARPPHRPTWNNCSQKASTSPRRGDSISPQSGHLSVKVASQS